MFISVLNIDHMLAPKLSPKMSYEKDSAGYALPCDKDFGNNLQGGICGLGIRFVYVKFGVAFRQIVE